MLTAERAREILVDFPRDDEIEKFATITGPNDCYRYQLSRVWDYNKPFCLWCMLNPSTADGKVDDATIRKCERFAFLWGCGGIIVVNLFAYRSRHPRMLLAAPLSIDPTRGGYPNPVGPENDLYIKTAAEACEYAVMGWGALPFAVPQARRIPQMLVGRRPQCLGYTKTGEPRHPLMLPYVTALRPFTPPEN